jgi:hypothetical protein
MSVLHRALNHDHAHSPLFHSINSCHRRNGARSRGQYCGSSAVPVPLDTTSIGYMPGFGFRALMLFRGDVKCVFSCVSAIANLFHGLCGAQKKKLRWWEGLWHVQFMRMIVLLLCYGTCSECLYCPLSRDETEIVCPAAGRMSAGRKGDHVMMPCAVASPIGRTWSSLHPQVKWLDAVPSVSADYCLSSRSPGSYPSRAR